MDSIKTQKHYHVWKGTYKGINFEVKKWKHDYVETTPEYDRGFTWNYYIFVKPRELKTYTMKLIRADERVANYSEMYFDVEMHGGITYWSRHTNSRLQYITDEIGCDYAHSWDHDDGGLGNLRERTIEEVLLDVKHTIDTLPADLFFQKP